MKGFKESKVNTSGKNKKNSKNKNSVLLQNALILQKKGEFDEAAKIYNQLIKNKFFEEKVFLNYASICQDQNKLNDAIILYKEAIRINPKNFIPFFKVGFILNNRGMAYEAYPFAKKAIELNPNFWQGYHNFIKILRELNRPKDAASIVEKAKNLFSGKTSVYRRDVVTLFKLSSKSAITTASKFKPPNVYLFSNFLIFLSLFCSLEFLIL